MADKDPNEEKKMNLPPFPPGFARPGASQPSVPAGGRQPPPPMPGQIKPVPPPLPGGGAPAFPFSQASQAAMPAAGPAAPPVPQKDASAEEAARLKEEKDRLEKKISDMEHLLSQEKEKALLAALKSQQDEVLSSKVESSLKDIQDKLRRDRHEAEAAEERLTLKAKIKELETKLLQERETWMQTLKGQMQERESTSKDVEGHFLYRLQEMERRWLEEKAQWQKNFAQKEDEVRSLKHSAERLREVQDELRVSAVDRTVLEKEVSRLKDEVGRVEREKISVVAKVDQDRAALEAYMRTIPEKERELATLRAEVSMAKMREENARSDFKAREDKLVSEIDALQRDIGAVSDRKNAEKEEELRKLQARYEALLQEKENAVAQVSGEKIRAVSELVKVKGFIGRVQAVNAALEKERASLRLEKMQMAQAMAANIEGVKKTRQEMEHLKAAQQSEMEELVKKHLAHIDKVKADPTSEVVREYDEKIFTLQQQSHQETLVLKKKQQEELESLAAARQDEMVKIIQAHQEESALAAQAHQQELAHVSLAAQSEAENKIIEIKSKYETVIYEMKSDLTRQFEQEYTDRINKFNEQINRLTEDNDKFSNAKARLEEAAARMETEILRRSGEAKNFETLLFRNQKESMAASAQALAVRKKLEADVSSLGAAKAEHEQRCYVLETEVKRLVVDQNELKARLEGIAAEKTAKETELSHVAQNLKLESDNRARFESELLFLKQKVQQLESQAGDLAGQLETARRSLASAKESASMNAQAVQKKTDELSAEVEKYKKMEESFAQRLKWAFKGKKEGEEEGE